MSNPKPSKHSLLRQINRTDHHANGALLPPRGHLQAVIHHQVHEGVKPTQDPLDMATAVQLHCEGDGKQKC